MGAVSSAGMEGWRYLIQSNRLVLQYSQKRYNVLDRSSLNCYKSGAEVWLSADCTGWKVLHKSEIIDSELPPISVEYIPLHVTGIWLAKVANAGDAWLVDVMLRECHALNRDQRLLLLNGRESRVSVEKSVRQWIKHQVDNCPSKYKSTSGEVPSELPADNYEGDENHCTICEQVDCVPVECGDEVSWIACDYCPRWFHQACVGLTSEDVDWMDYYMCSDCDGGYAN